MKSKKLEHPLEWYVGYKCVIRWAKPQKVYEIQWVNRWKFMVYDWDYQVMIIFDKEYVIPVTEVIKHVKVK